MMFYTRVSSSVDTRMPSYMFALFILIRFEGIDSSTATFPFQVIVINVSSQVGCEQE